MDPLLFLCARCIVAQHPLPTVPAHLYPVLFQVAFLDGRPLVLRDLVAAWPSPVLDFQWLVGRRELLGDHPCIDYVKAIIQAVVAQLKQELEESGIDSSLRLLDMTAFSDSVSTNTVPKMMMWSTTNALAKACVEVSMHQQEFQRRGSEQHIGSSGAATAVVTLQPLGVDVHTDLFVDRSSYRILHDALQTRATGLLRLKCRKFHADNISALGIVTLLESLDPSCLRRVTLDFNNLGLTELLVILPHLSRFPELRSLRLEDDYVKDRRSTPESAVGICSVARHLGMLLGLRELSLRSTQFSGNLRQLLCDLQAPLESLELSLCSLVPDDLAFLSQSFHAPALKKLHLSDDRVSEGLLELLRLLLEKTSASLLYLNLRYCHIANSDLEVLLPTLLRCSRLRFLGLYRNPLSTAALKDLLQKTLELPDLKLVVYPYPMDCYKRPQRENNGDYGTNEDCERDEGLFAVAKAEFSEILANSGRTDLVWTDSPKEHTALDYFSL